MSAVRLERDYEQELYDLRFKLFIKDSFIQSMIDLNALLIDQRNEYKRERDLIQAELTALEQSRS